MSISSYGTQECAPVRATIRIKTIKNAGRRTPPGKVAQKRKGSFQKLRPKIKLPQPLPLWCYILSPEQLSCYTKNNRQEKAT